MITLPISLRHAGTPQRAAQAWLIPGSDVARWLKEWTSWRLPMAAWQVVIVPEVGALVLLPDQLRPRAPAAWPMGCEGRRLYLPTDAQIVPPAEAGEIESVLSDGVAIALALPGCPVYTFRAEQILSVADLLVPPPPSQADWQMARPGEKLNARLHSVLPDQPPNMQILLASAGDDIGTKHDQLEQLPERPDEPRDRGRDRARRAAASSVAALTAWAARQAGKLAPASRAQPSAPRSASAAAGAGGQERADAAGGLSQVLRSALQRAATWAQAVTQRTADELDQLRHREIQRLLHLLKQDPDQGLRYALPLKGSDQHRGRAAPGHRLPPRHVDFYSAGSTPAADPWNVSWEHYEQLRQQYIDLANRELRLGRYRRAAYVFAHLLGDWPAAAAALESGKYWREAAVIHRERLKQTRAAAECLERGGLLGEAIAMFEGLGEHEKVGDLYARLEQHEDAIASWRRALQSSVLVSNYLDAARIAFEKLNLEDEALSLWDQGWPQSSQARACLTKSFELLGARGRHEDAHQRLERLLATCDTLDLALLAAETLTDVVEHYPDRNVSRRGADTVRVLAARQLPRATSQQQSQFVTALSRLAPGDRQLARDGRRYIELQRTSPSLASPPPSSGKRLVQTRTVRTFQLPQNYDWQAATAVGNRFYAAGVRSGKLCVVRCRWDGELQQARFASWIDRLPESAQLSLAADPQGNGPLLFGSTFPTNEPAIQFAPCASFPQSELVLQPQPKTPVSAICYAHSMAHVLIALGDLYWLSYAVDGPSRLGALISKSHLAVEGPDRELVPVFGRKDLLAFGLGSRLLIFGNLPRVGKAPHVEQTLPGPIRTLVGSPSFTRLRIAAGLDCGAAYWSPEMGLRFDTARMFAESLKSPHLCFTPAGMLVAVAENGGEIYRTGNGKLERIRRFPTLSERPVALMATARAEQFAVLLPSGLVQIIAVE